MNELDVSLTTTPRMKSYSVETITKIPTAQQQVSIQHINPIALLKSGSKFIDDILKISLVQAYSFYGQVPLDKAINVAEGEHSTGKNLYAYNKHVASKFVNSVNE